MHTEDRAETHGVGHGESGIAWSRPRRLFGFLAGTVLLLGLALGLGGEASFAQSEDPAPRAATPVCATIPGGFTYKDTSGRVLAYYRMSQKSCWDGTRITYLGVPVITYKVTSVGQASGWSWNGIVGRRDYFFEYNGSPRGGHVTLRRASFIVCPRGGSCFEKRPLVKRYAYSNKAGRALSQG